MRRTLSTLALCALAACSSGSSTSGGVAGDSGSGSTPNGDSDLVFNDLATASGGDVDAVAFAAALDNFQTDVADISGRPLDDYNFTAFESVPAMGTASYSGFINVNAGASANLSAGLELDANFGTENLTAIQTSSFYANAGGSLQEYDGTLAFTNGKIAARGIPNSARLDIAGTLAGGGNTVVVNGEIFGKLVGTPIVGISANTTVAEANARSNPDRALNITLNGTAVTDGSAGFVVIDDTLR